MRRNRDNTERKEMNNERVVEEDVVDVVGGDTEDTWDDSILMNAFDRSMRHHRTVREEREHPKYVKSRNETDTYQYTKSMTKRLPNDSFTNNTYENDDDDDDDRHSQDHALNTRKFRRDDSDTSTRNGDKEKERERVRRRGGGGGGEENECSRPFEYDSFHSMGSVPPGQYSNGGYSSYFAQPTPPMPSGTTFDANGPPLSMPPGIPGEDKELANLLMAWYYSGYYTGQYKARQEFRRREEMKEYSRRQQYPPSYGYPNYQNTSRTDENSRIRRKQKTSP